MELNQINLSLSSTGNIEKGRQQIKSMRDHYEAVRKALNAAGFTHQAHATNYWLTVCYDNNNTLYEIPVQMGLRPSDYVEILKAVNGDKTKLNLDVYPDVIFGESAQTSESSSGDVEAASTGLSADISAVHCSWYESHNSIFDDFELVTIQRGPRNISEMANSNQYDDSDVYSLIFLSVVQLTMMIVVLYLNVSIMGDKFGDSHYLHYCVIYPLVAIITGFTMVNKLDDVAENKLSLKMQQMNSGEEDSSSGVSGWVYLCIDWLDLLTFKVRFLLIELFKMFVSFFFALYASLLILLHYIRA